MYITSTSFFLTFENAFCAPIARHSAIISVPRARGRLVPARGSDGSRGRPARYESIGATERVVRGTQRPATGTARACARDRPHRRSASRRDSRAPRVHRAHRAIRRDTFSAPCASLSVRRGRQARLSGLSGQLLTISTAQIGNVDMEVRLDEITRDIKREGRVRTLADGAVQMQRTTKILRMQCG